MAEPPYNGVHLVRAKPSPKSPSASSDTRKPLAKFKPSANTRSPTPPLFTLAEHATSNPVDAPDFQRLSDNSKFLEKET